MLSPPPPPPLPPHLSKHTTCLLRFCSDGFVKTSFKYTAEFACLMSVEPYPFDIHRCSIDVSVASDADLVSLEPGAGQQDLVDMPEAFEGTALMDEVEVLVNNNTPNGLTQTTVSYKMELRVIRSLWRPPTS